MSKKPAPAKVADSRHREAPFLQERERYLRYCADSGATSGALSIKRNELIWIARFLPATASQGVDIAQLHELVRRRTSMHTGVTMGKRMIELPGHGYGSWAGGVSQPWLSHFKGILTVILNGCAMSEGSAHPRSASGKTEQGNSSNGARGRAAI